MVKDIFQELRLDVPSIEKHIAPNMLCLRDLEVLIIRKDVVHVLLMCQNKNGKGKKNKIKHLLQSAAKMYTFILVLLCALDTLREV